MCVRAGRLPYKPGVRPGFRPACQDPRLNCTVLLQRTDAAESLGSITAAAGSGTGGWTVSNWAYALAASNDATAGYGCPSPPIRGKSLPGALTRDEIGVWRHWPGSIELAGGGLAVAG